MKNNNVYDASSRTVNILIAAGLVFLAAVAPAYADRNESVHGKSIGELSGGWWRWQEQNYPDFSFGEGVVNCSLGQSGPVWYLGGTGGGESARTCDAPTVGHKHLMFPLVNANFFNPDRFCEQFGSPDCTVLQKREFLDGVLSEVPAGLFNSKACSLQVEVDGVPAVYSTPIIRTQSPPFFYAGDPETVSGSCCHHSQEANTPFTSPAESVT